MVTNRLPATQTSLGARATTALGVPLIGGVAAMVQAMPSQCSTTAAKVPVSVPTAQASFGPLVATSENVTAP